MYINVDLSGQEYICIRYTIPDYRFSRDMSSEGEQDLHGDSATRDE